RSATLSAICAKNQPRSPATSRSCNRSSVRFASGRERAAITLRIASVLWDDGRRRDRTHDVADPDAAGDDDRAVDAEGQLLRPPLAPVAGERAERVEIRDARVRILG